MFLYKIKQGDKEVEFYHNDNNISKQILKEVKAKITYTYDFAFEDFIIESDFPIDFDSEFILLKKPIQKKDSMFNNNSKDSIDFLKNMFNMK